MMGPSWAPCSWAPCGRVVHPPCATAAAPRWHLPHFCVAYFFISFIDKERCEGPPLRGHSLPAPPLPPCPSLPFPSVLPVPLFSSCMKRLNWDWKSIRRDCGHFGWWHRGLRWPYPAPWPCFSTAPLSPFQLPERLNFKHLDHCARHELTYQVGVEINLAALGLGAAYGAGLGAPRRLTKASYLVGWLFCASKLLDFLNLLCLPCTVKYNRQIRQQQRQQWFQPPSTTWR